jgi:hypothetical protein
MLAIAPDPTWVASSTCFALAIFIPPFYF